MYTELYRVHVHPGRGISISLIRRIYERAPPPLRLTQLSNRHGMRGNKEKKYQADNIARWSRPATEIHVGASQAISRPRVFREFFSGSRHDNELWRRRAARAIIGPWNRGRTGQEHGDRDSSSSCSSGKVEEENRKRERERGGRPGGCASSRIPAPVTKRE